MIYLSIFYDDYMNRPDLTEEKRPFEYVVPPPLCGLDQQTLNT